jgi:hypothetical protein
VNQEHLDPTEGGQLRMNQRVRDAAAVIRHARMYQLDQEQKTELDSFGEALYWAAVAWNFPQDQLNILRALYPQP